MPPPSPGPWDRKYADQLRLIHAPGVKRRIAGTIVIVRGAGLGPMLYIGGKVGRGLPVDIAAIPLEAPTVRHRTPMRSLVIAASEKAPLTRPTSTGKLVGGRRPRQVDIKPPVYDNPRRSRGPWRESRPRYHRPRSPRTSGDRAILNAGAHRLSHDGDPPRISSAVVVRECRGDCHRRSPGLLTARHARPERRDPGQALLTSPLPGAPRDVPHRLDRSADENWRRARA